MNLLQPRPTHFDLRLRLFGAPVRIHPLFWWSSAILGIRYYADPAGGSLGYFLFWMAAVLASVLLHELAHVFVGRLFGMRAEVVLYGLGSLTLGLDALPRLWQRLVVLLAGALVQLLVVAAVWGVTCLPFPEVLREWGWRGPIATGTVILLWINYYWALLNLLPLWPLDGGRIACELGEGLLGRPGLVAALVLSLVASALLTLWVMVQMNWRLAFPYDPRYVLYLVQLGVLLFFCFCFWLRGVRALWPPEQSPPGGE